MEQRGLTVETISIHALREESDPPIYPREDEGDVFQSTPSARRATVSELSLSYGRNISIHALREESDRPRHPH